MESITGKRLSAAQLDDLMYEIDKNGDGHVTTEEFIQACLNQEGFTKILTLAVIDVFNAEQE